MSVQITTERLGALDLTDADNEILKVMLRKGRYWLRQAGLPPDSDDLALLTYKCVSGMSVLKRADSLDDDYLVAGDVLDQYVSDHDAELLCELVPLSPVEPVGSMTPEVTAVHDALLDVCGAMREAWESE